VSREIVKSLCIRPEADLHEALRVIDQGAAGIALVVDEVGRLLGTVTDGDIRRALLRGVHLGTSVREVMCSSPVTVPESAGEDEIIVLMLERRIRQLPVLDQWGRVVDVRLWDELMSQSYQHRNNPVVIMAGGLGLRLRPLTERMPKPLLRVGSKPILEIIVEQLRQQGFTNIILTVNYLSNLIEDYFGDGSQHGVRIAYIHEPEPLGTAGSLYLARDLLTQTFLVMNGDILTKTNLRRFLDFHEAEENLITLGVARLEVGIRYGVVELDGSLIKHVEEKPSLNIFVNAGIYALAPEALELLPAMERCDMTDLVGRAVRRGARVGGFPIHEYWLDVGEFDDFRRAQQEFWTHFSDDGVVHDVEER